MKATPSPDDEMRLTIRVAHRVSSATIVDALGWKLTRTLDFHETADPSKGDYSVRTVNKTMRIEAALKKYKSRNALLKVTMEAIAHEGAALWVWSDEIDATTVYKIREQARVLVAKKFPELKKLPVTTAPA